jgi:hypothetical protein
MIGKTKEKLLIELGVPDLVISNNISDLKTSFVVQEPVDITNGNWNNLKVDHASIANGGFPGGFLIYNNKLIGSAYAYYDGAYEGALSHFTASLNWSISGKNFMGMYRVGTPIYTTVNGGFVGGYMAQVPQAWQELLGGPALTGKGGLAIISRTSLGPCVWSFDPEKLGTEDPVKATMLLGYPLNHPTIGTYDGPSLNYNMSTSINGIVFPEESESILFFGTHGLGFSGKGEGCYGPGTKTLEEHGRTATSSPNTCNGQVIEGSNTCCFDPVNQDKGTHAYPYRPQIWAYNANDLAKVKSGEKNLKTGMPYQPWDIIPYAVWNPDLPFLLDGAGIKGAAYDKVNQRIFISAEGENFGFETFPLIHVYKISVSPTPKILMIK